MLGLRKGSLLLLGILVAGQAAPVSAQKNDSEEPPRVILFIGDGVGVSYWTAALFAADNLAVKEFPVVGLVDTRSTSSKVTDSAASATAFATGVATYNGAIGVGPDSQPRPTVLEIAESLGMATGLIATSSVTHATPAAFGAHVVHRSMEAEIAAQLAEQDIDVLMGGGRAFFAAALQEGSADLLKPLRSQYTYVETSEELTAIDPDTVRALLGLFAPTQMPPADYRVPELWEMTMAALDVLDKNPKGFFLMVEGSQPDWQGHGNAALEAVVAEVLDLDFAIGAGLNYQRRRPETLIVVVADHETGGLAIQDSTGTIVGRYTTNYHTAQLVPLFARGPGAEKFGGFHSIAHIGELLIEAVQR